MRRPVVFAIVAVALAGVVAAVALSGRTPSAALPSPSPLVADAEPAAPSPPPAPLVPAPAVSIPAPPAPSAPNLVRPPGPSPTSRHSLGTMSPPHAAGHRPSVGTPLERLLAKQGASPLAEARAATDPREAVAAYDRYLAAEPRGPLREQAMVGRAGALEKLGDRTQAAAAWRAVLDSYPGSMSAPQARRRLIVLQR